MAQQNSTHSYDCVTLGQTGESTDSSTSWDRAPTRIKRALLRAGVLRPEELTFWTLPEVVGIAGLGTKGRHIVERYLAGRGIFLNEWTV